MPKRKKIWTFLVIVAFLSATFIISFDYGMRRFQNNKLNSNKNNTLQNNDRVTSSFNSVESVSPKAKIIFKIEYKKSGDVVEKEALASEFIGKNKQTIENSGYIVESITSDEVSIKKVIDSYAPNKYVLGVKNQYLAIYKTDENGKMYIEDEANDITQIEVPTKGDFQLLVRGSRSFQFDTKDAAIEKLGEYDS